MVLEVVKIIVFKREKKNFIDLNEKRRREKRGGGLRFLAGRTQEGGGHSDAYCVQQGGWGGLKTGKKCVCN